MLSETHKRVISVRGVSKKYKRYKSHAVQLIELLGLGLRKRTSSGQEFTAVENINLDINQGETVGIIGRNGSGKSTLLQMICGTLTQTSGTIETEGKIGALLELGSGFNPNYTGIENIELNSAILGLSRKDLKDKIIEIREFAEIEDFVERPIREYSSGMVVRLAFAVQACIEPEILVVDEALAVGDETFQKKCFTRLERLKENGTAILLVSHSCAQINQHCDRAVLMSKGRI